MKKHLPLPPALVACLLCSCLAAENAGDGFPAPEPKVAHSSSFKLQSLLGKKAGDNRVFSKYDRSGSAQWNSGWPGRVDLTGIAWDSSRTATAITARHVVMAAHYPRRVGDTLVFHDREGTRHTRKLRRVLSLRGTPSKIDIAVGLLDRPLPGRVKTYPLLAPRADYANKLAAGLVLITDQERRLFIHDVCFVKAETLTFEHSPEIDKSLRTFLMKGDSGNPSFLLLKSGPVLLGTHSVGGVGGGPFYSSPTVFKALQNAVRKLDSGYAIKTVSLDAGFEQEATPRRTGRKMYKNFNPDGSLKRKPKPARKGPTPQAKPTKPSGNVSPRPSGGNQRPRVRRHPTPETPDPGP